MVRTHPPPNICLTAYGILEFTDMARVHLVDEAVNRKGAEMAIRPAEPGWFLGRDPPGLDPWAGRGSMTAFIVWALAECGDQSSNLDKALSYLRAHPNELATLYSRALAANAFLARDRNDTFGRELATQLHAKASRTESKPLIGPRRVTA